MPETPRKPDAVFVPPHLVPGGNKSGINGRIYTLDRTYRDVLGCGPRQAVRMGEVTQPNGLLLYPDRGHDKPETYYFATSHGRTGQDRYDWQEQPDGVLHGFKVEGADA